MRVEFINDNDTYITDPLFQWDINQELIISGMKTNVAPVFHFSNRKSTESILVQSLLDDAGVITVPVPNGLMKDPYNIVAIASTYENQKETTLYRIEIPIRTRVMPEDYYFTDNVPILTYESIEADIQSFYKKSLDAVAVEKSDRIKADENLNKQIDVERTRITQIASLKEGSTTGDAELIDARTSYDGIVYRSLGECVRNMQSEEDADIESVNDKLHVFAENGLTVKETEMHSAYFNDSLTIIEDINPRIYFVPIEKGKKYTIKYGANCNYNRYAFSKEPYSVGGQLFEYHSHTPDGNEFEYTFLAENSEYKYLVVYFWSKHNLYPVFGDCKIYEHQSFYAEKKEVNEEITDIKNHIMSWDGLVMSPVSRVFAQTWWGDYSAQAICYDTDKKKYCIAGGHKTQNGMSKICVTSDLYAFSDAEFYEVRAGHAGSIAYNPDTKILVVGTGHEVDEGDIAIIETTNYTVTEYVNIGQDAYAIIYDDGSYLIDTFSAMYRYDLAFNQQEIIIGDTSEYTVASYLGTTTTYTNHQTSLMHKDLIYTLYAYTDKSFYYSWRNACIIAVHDLEGKLVKYITVDNLSQSAEAESMIVMDNVLYIIYTGDYIEVSSTRLDGMTHKAPIFIPPNSDLDYFRAVGEYFVNNTSATNTIKNRPLLTNHSGFTLIVKNLARNCVIQIYIPSLDFDSYGSFPIYVRRSYDKWSKWFKFDGIKI